MAELKRVGKMWRRVALQEKVLPKKLLSWWNELIEEKKLPINRINESQKCTLAILDLLAAADEASVGLGLFFSNTHHSDPFEREAEWLLFANARSDCGATLCRRVASSKGRVLPKMHTPQNGLTIRSMSHHLAYSYSPDVRPEWLSAAIDNKHHCFNLLAVPWPTKLEPMQFERSRMIGIADVLDKHPYGLFTFKLSQGPTVKYVEELVKEAEKSVGKVDGIIFPELSMSHTEFDLLSEEFVSADRFLIAGVGTTAHGPNKCGTNEALLAVGVKLEPDVEFKATFTQKKHHRWKLTKPQIIQYGLGSNLHPGADWWEHIAVGDRTLSFVSFRTWLTMSALLCEDLARPDPVGDVIRAVGPNLIVALLCDAPQLLGRWPGRYAGALADDPGSSVLTLTSIGASKLSKPRGGSTNRCHTVALWRDAKQGAQEIELPEGADALLLNLSVEFADEWTADGRGDDDPGGYPVLCGIHPIYVKEGATLS